VGADKKAEIKFEVGGIKKLLLRFESWILDSTSGQLVFNGLSKLKSDY
jgi:hypothetical protein